MKISQIKILILPFLSVTLFSQIESLALSIGTSWAFAKISPYAFTVISGIVLGLQIKKKYSKNTSLKYISIFLAIILPFSIGFALHPIYEGDFTNTPGEKIKIN